MDRQEFAQVIEKVKATGLPYKEYPNTYLINVTDTDGTIQSFYASTGTAVFRDGNDKFKSQKHSEYNMPLDRFLKLCSGEEDIITAFFN